MAGNKMNTKKKDDKGKSSKNADQESEETEDIDFSLLRKPILTSITGFGQARKIFDVATEELKALLNKECDLLYECKVCRNIFRSLANFISHKRVYCKEQFSSAIHGHFLKETSVVDEVLKIKKLEEGYQESLKDTNHTDEDKDSDARIPMTKDLTSIVERITMNQGVQRSEVESKQMSFQPIPKSSVAVFQNVDTADKKSDTMKAQVTELHSILSQENAVLQKDGSFKVQSGDKLPPSDGVIQISDDEDGDDSDVLKCKICELQFSTMKTLKFHIKYKHLENRLVYPCPDCLDIFSTSWSVYRHLFKVHRKTAAQIRRLRESIQAKAFRKNNPPAFYEKRKTLPKSAPTQKITEEERLIKENQAWLEELDGESEGRRCGGCGRAFERRAALAAHTHTCARRQRRPIQIQIRKDYHKEPASPYLAASAQDAKTNSEDSQKTEKEQVAKDVKDENEEDPLIEAEMTIVGDKKHKEESEMEIDEPAVQNTKQTFYHGSMINNLPYAQQLEKNNLNAFKQKIQLDIDINRLSCKKCDVKYDKINELLNHMAAHYKWVRYACKLCNFKHFDFEKVPEHVKVVHKLKGNTDFYYSTVKAIDGAEALELSELVDDVSEANGTSPDSRRPSRCSSDSSRLSDDSSSSSTRIEVGSRKRKCNIYKSHAKKKRDARVRDNVDQKEEVPLTILEENETTPKNKIFEENSSDIEIEDKPSKRQSIDKPSSVASRRPVRKKTKPKNADFEYDLSNLLKLEAQGYRDTRETVCTNQSKKKAQQDVLNNYDVINKDCSGAMITLSRKSVEIAQGHMKTSSLAFKSSKESRISSIFARPMIPRVSRMEKVSPKKVENEESNDVPSPSKTPEPISNLPNYKKDTHIKNKINELIKEDLENSKQKSIDVNNEAKDSTKDKPGDTILNVSKKEVVLENEESKLKYTKNNIVDGNPSSDITKSNLNMVPLKFRRQSLDIVSNPLIKKKITDFTKAGMKTKILVIKPINRNTSGPRNLHAPLKFQTIKLKDPSKSNATDEEKKTDQVMVVKVPEVDCGMTRPVSRNKNIKNRISPAITDSTLNCENEKSKKGISSNDVTVNNKDVVNKILENNLEEKTLHIENIADDSSTSTSEILISESVDTLGEVLMDEDQSTSQSEIIISESDDTVGEVLMEEDQSTSQSEIIISESVDTVCEVSMNEDQSTSQSDIVISESVDTVGEVLMDEDKSVSPDS